MITLFPCLQYFPQYGEKYIFPMITWFPMLISGWVPPCYHNPLTIHSSHGPAAWSFWRGPSACVCHNPCYPPAVPGKSWEIHGKIDIHIQDLKKRSQDLARWEEHCNLISVSDFSQSLLNKSSVNVVRKCLPIFFCLKDRRSCAFLGNRRESLIHLVNPWLHIIVLLSVHNQASINETSDGRITKAASCPIGYLSLEQRCKQEQWEWHWFWWHTSSWF